MAYNLGPVLPHVRRAAELVGPMFGVTSILGWRATAVDMAGHPAGRALDFMCTRAQGDQIAEYLLAHAAALGIQYVIWRQRYREPGGQWEAMEDRGSPTQNHMDHVHGNFTVRGGDGTTPDASTGASTATGDAGTTADASTTEGWADGAMAVGLKAAGVLAAGALLILGVRQTVTTRKD